MRKRSTGHNTSSSKNTCAEEERALEAWVGRRVPFYLVYHTYSLDIRSPSQSTHG